MYADVLIAREGLPRPSGLNMAPTDQALLDLGMTCIRTRDLAPAVDSICYMIRQKSAVVPGGPWPDMRYRSFVRSVSMARRSRVLMRHGYAMPHCHENFLGVLGGVKLLNEMDGIW